MAGEGGNAHRQQRHKDPETTRGTQADPNTDAQQNFHGRCDGALVSGASFSKAGLAELFARKHNGESPCLRYLASLTEDGWQEERRTTPYFNSVANDLVCTGQEHDDSWLNAFSNMYRLIFISLSLLAPSSGSLAQTNIAPRAEQILRDACQYLAETPHFSITAEIWQEHVTDQGEKLQFTRQVEMQVKRPNKLHLEIHSPHSERGFWYEGKDLSFLDAKRNFYSSTEMPNSLDTMIDAAHDQFGIDLPLIDLALSNPFRNATARVQEGKYIGMASAMGYNCHHLAFTQENIDWQVWIQDGPQPLIRKFVIVHKQDPGAPEFTGLIRNWNLLDRIAESEFVFRPPLGSSKVQMHKNGTGQEATPQQPADRGVEKPPSATGK